MQTIFEINDYVTPKYARVLLDLDYNRIRHELNCGWPITFQVLNIIQTTQSTTGIVVIHCKMCARQYRVYNYELRKLSNLEVLSRVSVEG